MHLNSLVDYIGTILEPQNFSDYCPNGLQVQGRSEIKKVVTGVTASMDFLEAAKNENADAVLVHHGFFWKNESPCLIGIKQKRIKFLLENDISLLAYHLPLDAHPKLGNNAQLAKVLKLKIDGFTGQQNILAYGYVDQSQTLLQFSKHISKSLGRLPMIFGDDKKIIKKVAWCTGAAQSYMEEAIALGADVFISGEVSEQTYHLAKESGVAFIAAGHHATERYGINALGIHLNQHLSVDHQFIDIDNPI
jgi:dinuclear metal center YbgI/SA1388 family protein